VDSTPITDLLGVEQERVRLWIVARAAEPRDDRNDDDLGALARAIAPR
jgi:hypothetical protein